MSAAIERLIRLLDVEEIETNLYRGRNPPGGGGRVFGGQVASQALMAAGRTLTDARRAHSLHAYFLRPGLPGVPIVYNVDRLRDGRSFTTRNVVAVQHGEAIFNMSASFHRDEPGLEYQVPMPEVPAPEQVGQWQRAMMTFAEKVAPEARRFARANPIEMHPISVRDGSDHDPELCQRFWMRAAGELPDDDLLHQCVLAFASDMSLLSASMKEERAG